MVIYRRPEAVAGRPNATDAELDDQNKAQTSDQRGEERGHDALGDLQLIQCRETADDPDGSDDHLPNRSPAVMLANIGASNCRTTLAMNPVRMMIAIPTMSL